MDDWQKDWWKQIENTTEVVEKFFSNVNQTIESFSAEVVEVVEELGEQLQDTIAIEINRFVEDFSDSETDSQTNYQANDRVDSETESNLENEFNLFWQDIKDSIKEFVNFEAEYNLDTEFNIWQDIENFVEDSEFVEISTETPTKDNHAACIECNNYHGQAYNGQIFVCAMHPYGVEDDSCPDWEQSTSNYHDFF